MSVVIDRHNIRRVAIIDDDADQAEAVRFLVEDAGYEPIVLGDGFDREEQLMAKIQTEVDGVVCDHRLNPGGKWHFSGAEFVARLFNQKIPAILRTQFYKVDHDVSIRLYRRYIPVLLPKTEVNPDQFNLGFEQCLREISGHPVQGRKPRRALVHVESLDLEGGEQVVDAIVPSWDPRQAVRFPAQLILQDIPGLALRRDQCFLAMVNIGAEQEEDLFFYGFELAPDPIAEDQLA